MRLGSAYVSQLKSREAISWPGEQSVPGGSPVLSGSPREAFRQVQKTNPSHKTVGSTMGSTNVIHMSSFVGVLGSCALALILPFRGVME